MPPIFQCKSWQHLGLVSTPSAGTRSSCRITDGFFGRVKAPSANCLFRALKLTSRGDTQFRDIHHEQWRIFSEQFVGAIVYSDWPAVAWAPCHCSLFLSRRCRRCMLFKNCWLPMLAMGDLVVLPVFGQATNGVFLPTEFGKAFFGAMGLDVACAALLSFFALYSHQSFPTTPHPNLVR